MARTYQRRGRKVKRTKRKSSNEEGAAVSRNQALIEAIRKGPQK